MLAVGEVQATTSARTKGKGVQLRFKPDDVSSIVGPVDAGGGRTFGWSLGLSGLFDGLIGLVGRMLGESINNVLVNTNGSFRVFIVTMNILCYDVTSITFRFSYFCSSRSNDRIVARSSCRRRQGGWAPR